MMRRPPFEQAAVGFADIKNRYEGIGVDLADGVLYLRHFQTRNDAVQNLRRFPLVSPFAVKQRNGAAHVLGHAAGHFVVSRRHDEQPLHFVEAVRHDIDHLIGDKIGYQGVHGAVPGKDEARAA